MGFTLKLFRMVAPIAILLGSGWAQTSIVMGRSSSAATFTGSGQIILGTLRGSGFLDSDFDSLAGQGSYIIQSSAALQYDRLTGAVSAPSPTLFTYSLTDETGTFNKLTAEIHWDSITVNANSPVLTGVMSNLTTTGSSDFLTAFSRQSTINFQVAFLQLCPQNVGTVCTLADLSSGSQVALKANSANTLPDTNPIPAPEPASLALLGSGLMVVGGTIRRRLKK